MSERNIEELTVEGLQIKELMLDGKIDLKRVKNSKQRDKVKKALQALKKQGLPIPSFSSLKREEGKKGEGTADDEEEDEKQRKDRFALKDYVKRMTDLLSQINSATAPNRRSQSSNIREVRLDSKLGNIAQQYYGIAYDFMSHVKNSKSKFYPEQAKKDAKEFMTEMEIAIGKRGVGSRVAAMRFAFTPIVLQLLRQPFPDIDVSMIYDYNSLVELQREYAFFKPYIPKSAVSSQSWGKFNDTKDVRGIPDVNVVYYLPFLEITPYFKDLLREAGVSVKILNQLDNYMLPLHGNVDEDEEFNDKQFVKVNLGGGLKGTSEEPDEDSLFKNWAGNTQLSKFQLDLLGFVKKFKLRAEAVLSVDHQLDVDEIDNRLEGSGRNCMNPDLAVKLWMHLALNAVYKVILEDSFGLMDRVNQSMIDNIARGVGASLPDMAMQLLNTNKIFFTKPSSDVKTWLKGGPFRFHNGIYQYLKSNWAPSIKSYRNGVKRYIGDSQIDEEQYSFYAIPKLVLPCNPYDSHVAWYESHQLSTALGSSENERNPLFKEEFLPYAYLDTRTKHDLRGLTVYFDNMLSYSLYVTKRNRRYNAHSYMASMYDNGKKITLDDIEPNKSGEFDYADKEFQGPFCLLYDKVGGISRRRSFSGELYASCLDRAQRCGLDRGYAYQYVHPIFGQLVQDDKLDSSLTVNLPAQLWYHYNNSLSVRFFLTAYWYSKTPSYLARRSDMNTSLTRFLDNVVETKVESLAVSNNAGEAVLINTNPDKDAELLVRDAFRYSYVFSDSKSRVLLDNKKMTGQPAVILSMTGDLSSPGNTRRLSIHRTNIGKGKTNQKSIIELFQDFDGHVNFLFGAGLEQSNARQRFGDCLGYNAIGGKSIFDILKDDSQSYSIHNDSMRLHLGGQHALPSKYGTGKSYIQFSVPNAPATFTTRVSACSYNCYKGNPEELDASHIGVVEDTYGGKLYSSGSDNPMRVWRKAIKDWDAENNQLMLYANSVDEFNDIVDFIFSKFALIREQDNRVDVEGTMHLMRYSVGIPVVVSEHIGDVDSRSEVNLIVDPVLQGITGIGHLIGNMKDWNPKQTAALADKLGQKVIDSIGPNCYNLVSDYYHGVTAIINDSMIYANLRKMLYTSPLPDTAERKALNQGNILI